MIYYYYYIRKVKIDPNVSSENNMKFKMFSGMDPRSQFLSKEHGRSWINISFRNVSQFFLFYGGNAK